MEDKTLPGCNTGKAMKFAVLNEKSKYTFSVSSRKGTFNYNKRPSACKDIAGNADERQQCPATAQEYTEALAVCRTVCVAYNTARNKVEGVDCTRGQDRDGQEDEAKQQNCCKGFYLKLDTRAGYGWLCKGFNHIGSVATKIEKRTKDGLYSTSDAVEEGEFVVSFSVLMTGADVDWTTSTTSVRWGGAPSVPFSAVWHGPMRGRSGRPP